MRFGSSRFRLRLGEHEGLAAGLFGIRRGAESAPYPIRGQNKRGRWCEICDSDAFGCFGVIL